MSGYAHVIKEDLVNPKLLFLGTELGLWVSLDGGKQLGAVQGRRPPERRRARPRRFTRATTILVIATHGRGIWIVDDITPLRSLTDGDAGARRDVRAGQARRPAHPARSAAGVNGDAAFDGPNPPCDAVIIYYQKKRHIFGDLKIEVFGPDGKLLTTLPTSKRRGLSRSSWSMRLKAPARPARRRSVAFGANSGPRVLPGTYTVQMTKDKKVYETKIQLVPDPRSTHTPEDRKAQFDLAMKLYGMLGDMTFAVERINGVRAALEERAAKLPAERPPRARSSARPRRRSTRCARRSSPPRRAA